MAALEAARHSIDELETSNGSLHAENEHLVAEVRRLEHRIACDLSLVQKAQAEVEAACRERDAALSARDDEASSHEITRAELEEARRLLALEEASP